jgi:hypothetical protein
VPSLSVTKGYINTLMNRVSILKRSIDKSWHLIEDLLLKPVQLPVSSPKKRQRMSTATVLVDNVDKLLIEFNSCQKIENWLSKMPFSQRSKPIQKQEFGRPAERNQYKG